MSRIGRLPVKIPAGVTITTSNEGVTVKGPLGTLSQEVNKLVTIAVKDGHVVLTRSDEEKSTKALHGLYRALIANMVHGVTQGYSKNLVIAGVGIKVAINGGKLVMSIGFSHTVEFEQPKGLTFEVVTATPNQVELAVKGIDKEAVGQMAASIKAVKKVEPYHGYGIRYKDEIVVRKEGKTAGK
ncbi:MAG: 50S ribosomal protein L6 [Clostridia bacterium]